MIEKIKKILEIYSNKKSRAETWEIGTNFFQSWKIIGEKLKTFPKNILLPNKITIKKMKNDSKNKNDRFQLLIENTNITPINKKEKYAAKSTILQYLQEGSALGFCNYSIGDKIYDGAEFSINTKIWDITNENYLIDHLLFTLIKSTNNSIYFEKNLGYSLFLSLLIIYKNDEFLSNFNNHIITRMTNSKNKKWKVEIDRSFYLSENYALQFLKHLKGENTSLFESGKKSYIEACEKLLKKYSFENIVTMMYQYINDPSKLEIIESIDIEHSKLHLKFENICKELQSKRSNLKNNIINQRVFDEKEYSDLIFSPQNCIDIKHLEACHIYDVYRIKLELKNIILKNKEGEVYEIIKEVDDPNNGILLHPTSHKFFDKGIVWFDSCGNLCFRNENKNDVKKVFGEDIECIKIKNEVLNNEMKSYFNKRI